MGNKMTFVIYLVLFLVNFHDVTSVTKIWTKTNDLDDPSGWMDSSLPCIGQRVDLPEQVLIVPSNMPPMGPEIVLPSNGMLVFPGTGEGGLSFADATEKKQDCPRRNAVFLGQDFADWHDPDNWRDEVDNAAVPQLRRIPCRHDDVVFPRDKAFRVALSHHDIQISHLNIGGRRFDSTTFRATLASPIGRLVFKADKTLQVSENHCMDPAGCMCGNIEIRETVCSMPSTSCDKSSRCSGGLKSKEHCCYDICGAIIRIYTYGEKIKQSLLEDVAADLTAPEQKSSMAETLDLRGTLGGGNGMKKALPSDVDFSVSRVGTEEYEMIFVDRNGNVHNAIQTARQAYNILEATFLGASIWVEESGVSPPSALTAVGEVMGTLFGLAVVLGLLYGLSRAWTSSPGLSAAGVARSLAVRLRRSGSSDDFTGQFQFNRFSGQGEIRTGDDGRVEVLDPVTMTMRRLEEEEGVVRSFSNPMAELAVEPCLESESDLARKPQAERLGAPFAKLISIVEDDESVTMDEHSKDYDKDQTSTEDLDASAPLQEAASALSDDQKPPPLDLEPQEPLSSDEQKQVDTPEVEEGGDLFLISI